MLCVQQMSASYYLTAVLIIVFLSNNLMVNCVTRPFISAEGVASETTRGSPPEFLDFYLLPVQTTKILPIMGSICHCSSFVRNEQI